MPDITLPYNPALGDTSSATGFNENLYDPSATPSSFEVINGWLDRANRESAWKVSWDKVRPGSMAWADSVGTTANLDYFCAMFPQDPDVTGAFTPIPGASKTVYVKRAGGTVLVCASLVVGNSLEDTTSNGMRLRLYRRAYDATTFSLVTGSQQVVASGQVTLAGTSTKQRYRDRQYTFHFLDVSVSVGEYEYALCVWLSGTYATTTIVSGVPTANLYSGRVRVRSMTTTWTG